MTAPTYDILPGLYAAIAEVTAITSLLGTFNDNPSIHTRRPVPDDAEFPLIVVGPVISATMGNDGINDFRPSILIDISVYGSQPDQYRTVETISRLIFTLFHRQRRVFTVDNYEVVSIAGDGPYPSPVDDEEQIGRRVSLMVDLCSKPV